MIADLALNQLGGEHLDCGDLGRTGVLADAATRAALAENHRQEHGVLAQFTPPRFDADGFVTEWADPIADLATQALPGETMLRIDEGETAS